MKLCNFSNTDYHLSWYNQSWHELSHFLNTNQLDGIELLLHGNYDISNIPKGIVKGVHLSYFPTWLEFYKQDPIYIEDFPTEADLKLSFGSHQPESIIQRFKKDFEVSKTLDAHYMVYHVGHVRTKDAFSFQYDYSNAEVLDYTAEIINQVFTEDSGIELLFENLWWPGLTLLSKDELENFMSKINYKNKGVMLDLSHLMLTAKSIKTFDQAVTYILECLNNLGSSIRWIKGIHINGTLAHEYLNESHTHKYDALKQMKKEDEFMKIYEHIKALDQHIPFASRGIQEIINCVKPTYQMIEVVGENRSTWEQYIIKQLEYMNDIYT